MKVVITGGGGMLGFKLAKALLARGRLTGADGKEAAITRLTLFDMAFPATLPQDPRLETIAGDISAPGMLAKVVTPDTQSIFHLASVVSSGAEADFDLGWRVNLDGARTLLELARNCAKPPRFLFSSSVAAFGGDLPGVLDDSTTPNPQTSYGAQKVCCEYLVTDYTRKGYIDGRSLRLPTIVVRPGKPNLAASSFASGVLREPLNGVISECPVSLDTDVWLLSPGRCVESFIHAHETPSSAWGMSRVLNLPGITAPVSGMVEAMRRVAGDAAAKRVVYKPDERIQKIVAGWPVKFKTPRALAMGFKPDADLDSVIRAYIADEGIKPA
ncbi:MAG: SDR family oxidoreductase [Betaproteobacteria bacterium]|nr:SDR family oxidoreductase [Betaproteobacteria bacterium]